MGHHLVGDLCREVVLWIKEGAVTCSPSPTFLGSRAGQARLDPTGAARGCLENRNEIMQADGLMERQKPWV